MDVKIFPNTLKGKVVAPPSKSFLQRALILSAFSDEKTLIKTDVENLSSDVIATLEALKAFGVKIDFLDSGIEVLPVKGERLPDKIKLDAVESGATLRFFIPIVAFLEITAEFTGSGSLVNRPFDEYIGALKGVGFSSDKLPFIMHGKSQGKVVVSAKKSSQYLSGLLLASAVCGGNVAVTGECVSKPYIDLTLDLIKRFGVNVVEKNGEYFIESQQLKSPKIVECEGDYSSCAFYCAVNFIGGKVKVKGLNCTSKQGDKTAEEKLAEIFNENVKNGVVIDITDTPDLLPILAVATCFTKNTVKFVGVERLKDKESNRPKNVCDLICAMQGNASVCGDGLTVAGSGKLKGGCTLKACNDHRILEACVLASTYAENPTEILGAECVKKSYPRFLKDVISLGGKIDVVRL